MDSGWKKKKRAGQQASPVRSLFSKPLHMAPDEQAAPHDEMMVAPAVPWSPTEIIDHPSPAYKFNRPPSPQSPLGFAFDGPPECPPSPRFYCRSQTTLRSIPSTPRASMEVLGPSDPTPITSPLQPPIDLLQVSTASCPPAFVPVGPPVPIAYLHPTVLDPVTHTVVLVSGISTTLSARLQISHQSLLEPVFQVFAERVLKTRPAIVVDEVKALLKKYATGFNYDGTQQVREEITQAFMHNWVQMALDCATAAKELLSKDVCESINMQLRDMHVKSTLGETLLETIKLTLNQCLARANERIKELTQDHMVIIYTHDRQRLATKANALRDQVFRGAQVSDNVRTVVSEVLAYFNISSSEFIDGCIRIILRQLMHELSLRLSSELFGALKLSEAGLPERCRIWVE